MIENLLDIEPDNEAIIFLSKRLKSQNYRGNHLVQHQRSSLNELVGVLLSIYSVVKEGKLIVPKGDPKTEDDVAVYPEYKTMVTLYQTVFNIGSYSSIKKVDFLNLARMGLLDRFDKKDKLYPTYKKASKMNSVALSKIGIELLFNPKKADYIFTQAMDVLFDGFMSEIYELFQYKDLKGYITLDEFTLFVSYLGLTLKDESNSTTIIDIAKYIKSFRQLKKHQSKAVIEQINNIAKSTKNLGKNKGKIDFGNWKNQAGSVFNLISYAANFSVQEKNRLIFGKKKKGTLITLERSLKEKEAYFTNHNLNYEKLKGTGYELHHIYPISLASSDEEFIQIDSWENLIFIDGKKHAEITQKRNKHIKLDFITGDDAQVSIPSNSQEYIALKINDNIIYEIKNKDAMVEKNKKLLNL